MKAHDNAESALAAVGRMVELLRDVAEEAEKRRKIHAGDVTLAASIHTANRYAGLHRTVQGIIRDIGKAVSLYGLETVVRDVYAKREIEAQGSGHMGMSLGVIRQYGADGSEILGMGHDASNKGAA